MTPTQDKDFPIEYNVYSNNLIPAVSSHIHCH